MIATLQLCSILFSSTLSTVDRSGRQTQMAEGNQRFTVVDKSINQSIKFIFAMLVIKQQEKYNTKLETKTKQCAGRLRVDLAVFKSEATLN